MKVLLLALFIFLTGCKKDEYGPNAEPCTCKAMYLWERKYKDSIYIANDPEYLLIINEVNQIRPKYKYFYYWDTITSPIYYNTPDYPFYCKDTFATEYYLDTITPHNWIYDKRRLFCID